MTPEAVARRLRRARGLAHVRARRRPLREPVLRGRPAGRGCGRARREAAAVVVPPLGQPDRLGGSRGREHAVRRTARRDGARRRSRLGASVTYPAVRGVEGQAGRNGDRADRPRRRHCRLRRRLRRRRAGALGAGREPGAALRAGARRHRGARPPGRAGLRGDEADRRDRPSACGGDQEARGHDTGREGAGRLARRVLPLLLQRAASGGQALHGGLRRGLRRSRSSRAKPSLASAEALATRMGAPECAVRPFPDA